MTEFAQLVREDRRLVLLKLLQQSEGYQANQYLLHMAMPGQGHTCSIDQVRADLAWLAEQGLITKSEVGGLMVAKLTNRGDDIASARASVPGVKRPRPE